MDESLISVEQWRQLNNLTATVYTSPADRLLETVLESVKPIVPFSHSLYYLQKKNKEDTVFFGMNSSDISSDYINSYVEKYSKYDFINWYTSNCVKCEVFRESDIITKDSFAKSPFVQNWMIPAGLYYGAGMVVADEDKQYGALFIYRKKEEGDFTDRETAVLEVVNQHILKRFLHLTDEEYEMLYLNGGQQDEMTLQALTRREREIINHLASGTYRNELCDKLYITENTLNKHLDNIYKKLSINSFEELLRITSRSKQYNRKSIS